MPVSGATACSNRGVLGDLEEALNAARAIGDDRLQQRSQGAGVPGQLHSWYVRQRYNWFKRGMDSGDPAQCDTFSGQL